MCPPTYITQPQYLLMIQKLEKLIFFVIPLFWTCLRFIRIKLLCWRSQNNKIMNMMEDKSKDLEEQMRPSTKQSTMTTFHQTRRSGREKLSLRKYRSQYSDTVYSSQSPARNKSINIRKTSPSPQRKMLYWQNWLLPVELRKNPVLKQPTYNSKSVCAIFSDADDIFLSHNCREILQVASLTKIMTAFTVINICNSFGIKIRETWIKIDKSAAMMEGTSANLRIGQQILVIDLLYGLMLPSGNDAGVALAEYFGKYLSYYYSNDQKYNNNDDEDMQLEAMAKFQAMKDYYDSEYKQQAIKLFVFEMNKNGQKIGLKDTKFNNPTGLTDQENVSTAADICKLISFCLKNHILRSIFKKKNYICEAKHQKLAVVRQIQWRNTNKHLFLLKDCIGVKTGITPGAGPCLSTVYKIKGRELIVVVLNSSSLEDRYIDCENIYRYTRQVIQSQCN